MRGSAPSWRPESSAARSSRRHVGGSSTELPLRPTNEGTEGPEDAHIALGTDALKRSEEVSHALAVPDLRVFQSVEPQEAPKTLALAGPGSVGKGCPRLGVVSPSTRLSMAAHVSVAAAPSRA